VSSDAPEVPATQSTEANNPRVVLARRAEFALIALGGVFIIFGWGIGHQEWARAVGWLFAGIGFAIEMVYGKVVRKPRAAARGTVPETAVRPTDESGS
jgi:hypothetical protein